MSERLPHGFGPSDGHIAVIRPVDQVIVRRDEMTSDRVEALKRTYFKGLDEGELAVAMAVVERTGLSPEARQIFFIKRYDTVTRTEVMQPQVSIDGFRLIAERSGKYAGQVGPWWCGPDGIWHDIWLVDEPPVAAKIGVLHRHFREPVFAVARFASYVQKTREGRPTKTWAAMPDVMIAKCAESLALRRAFPQELTEVQGMSAMVESGADPAPDPRIEAMRAMHGAGDAIGMGHDRIKQFVAETTRRSLDSLGSMREWSQEQFAFVTGLIEDRGQAWMGGRQQGVDDSGARDDRSASRRPASASVTEIRPGESIDPETGEIVPAEFPPNDVWTTFDLTDADADGER